MFIFKYTIAQLPHPASAAQRQFINPSFESGQLHGGVVEHAEQNLASLVDPKEALPRVVNDFGGESFSVLDQSLFDDFQHLVGASADCSEVVEHFSELLQIEVSVQALVNQLLLDQLPELVVLEGH